MAKPQYNYHEYIRDDLYIEKIIKPNSEHLKGNYTLNIYRAELDAMELEYELRKKEIENPSLKKFLIFAGLVTLLWIISALLYA